MRLLAMIQTLVLAALLAACGASTSNPAAVSSDAFDAAMAQYNEGLPARGNVLPALAAATLDGTPVTNASLRGKTVLLNFWFFH